MAIMMPGIHRTSNANLFAMVIVLGLAGSILSEWILLTGRIRALAARESDFESRCKTSAYQLCTSVSVPLDPSMTAMHSYDAYRKQD